VNSPSLPRRWRGLVASAAVLGVAVTSFGLLQSADAASSKVTISVTDPVVGGDRLVSVRLSCGSAKACRGKSNASIRSAAVSYKLKRSHAGTVKIRLSAAQVKRLGVAGRARVAVKVTGTVTKTARATLRPATRSVTVATRTASVATDRTFSVSLSCAAAAACKGTVTTSIGTAGPARSYALGAGRTAPLALTLTPAQYAKIGAKATTVAVTVAETAPEKVSNVAYLSLTRKAVVEAPEPVYSVAYLQRNWTPTEYDTCPAELHKAYSVTGPDGKIYPTWHPAQVTDPATGKLCTFGHEHGADPTTSDIYDWVANYYDNGQNAKNKGIPFGYVSERLEDYGHEHAGMTMRHEDNGGHKIAVANNVKLLDANRDWVRDGDGKIVVCDYLIKYHQGSWSPDATSNNAHELLYAAKCTDGTEIISSTLSMYGNSNQFLKTCDGNAPVTTIASTLPNGYGGSRIIPDSTCVAKNATGASAALWGIYELWSSENRLTTADGTVLASFDPWFGTRNPSRYYDAANSTATANGVSRTVDLAWGANAATGYPWSTVNSLEKFDYRDPRSPFDGAQRDFYLNQTKVAATAPATVYTNPYGGDAATSPSTGSIAQHLVAGSASNVTLATQKFDTSADYGLNNGVHAPN